MVTEDKVPHTRPISAPTRSSLNSEAVFIAGHINVELRGLILILGGLNTGQVLVVELT